VEENTSHIKLGIDPGFLGPAFSEKVLNEAVEQGIIFEPEPDPAKWSKPYYGFNAPHRDKGLFTIELPSKFPETASETIRNLLPGLVERWISHLTGISKGEDGFEKLLGMLHFRPACVYVLDGKDKLHFTFDFWADKNSFLDQWNKMLELIEKVASEVPPTLDWLDSIHRQQDKMAFLYYDHDTSSWKITDRLVKACEMLSTDYRSRLDDPRLGKPQIVFNEDNYNDYTYFGDQQEMKLNDLPLIIPQPNDISMYVRLADKNTKQAKEFFEKEYADKSNRYYLPLIQTEEVLEYYNYFESIMAAVTFSYTSIETLVNICIPEDFIFVQTGTGKNEGTTTSYSKKAIERKFHLREKLRQILPQSIQSPDPCTESWWNDFIALEEIRNEIIHTKQHKSIERYSSFLTSRIFTLIEVNKKIIRFYGEYIGKFNPQLLNEFPFDFGTDTLWPAFMSDEDFKDYYEKLHNPWRPDKSQ
jgi:hypothetical protein